jgi:integrase
MPPRRLTLAQRLAKAPPRKRAPRGTGSVYAEKDDAGHILRYRGEITVAGVRHRPSADTAELVWAKIAALREGRDPRTAAVPTDTVESWLRAWLADERRRTDAEALRPKTLFGYQRAAEVYLYPSLGDIPLTELRTARVSRFVDELRAHGLSNSRIHNVLTPLGRAMTKAVQQDRASVNPTRGLGIGRRGDGFKVAGGFSNRRIGALLDAFVGHPYYDIYALLYYLGCRIGELMALDWSSVRLAEQEVDIFRSYGFEWDRDSVGIHPAFGPPKTKGGTRTIALPDEAVSRLWKLYHKMGNPKHGLLFPSKFDPARPIAPALVLRRWKEGLARAGLPPMRLHDLRHIAISRALAANADIVLVSQRAGHAKPSITLSLYAHASAERIHEVAKTANVFGLGSKPPSTPGAAVPKSNGRRRPEAKITPQRRGATITPQGSIGGGSKRE